MTDNQTMQSQELTPQQAQAVLYRKLAQVMAGCARVPKSGFNKFHNYAYATDADVMDTVRPLLAAQRIALIPTMEEISTDVQGREGKEAKRTTRIKFVFSFVCGDTGAMVSSVWYSEADDTGDKGISKAATAALKYFLLKTFVISTGDSDDDSDAEEPRDKKSGAAQQKPAKPANAPQQGQQQGQQPPQAGTQEKRLPDGLPQVQRPADGEEKTADIVRVKVVAFTADGKQRRRLELYDAQNRLAGSVFSRDAFKKAGYKTEMDHWTVAGKDFAIDTATCHFVANEGYWLLDTSKDVVMHIGTMNSGGKPEAA